MKPVSIIDKACICNLGADWPTVWRRLLRGHRVKVEHGEIDSLLPANVAVAAVPNFARALDPECAGIGPSCQLAGQVLQRLTVHDVDAIYGATNHGETDAIVALTRGLREPAISENTDRLLVAMEQDPVARWAPRLGGFDMPASTWVYSACTSGAHAAAFASLRISRGAMDRAAVVAVDAVSSLATAGFSRISATTTGTVPPMCAGSNGILIGEGAVALVLSGAARPRDVALLGFGMSCDAGHQIHPTKEGAQLEAAVRHALAAAGRSAASVVAVIAHGTGTPANDAMEASVLERVFGRSAVPVTSVKGMTGHVMGASGLLNILVACEAIKAGMLPPTGGADFTPLDGLDLVLGEARPIAIDGCIVSISSGFGGNHCAAVVGSLP
mgnify:CR=1 FL=1